MGILSSLSAAQARVNLSAAGAPAGSHFETHRYGRGEIGEHVLIAGQQNVVLGRLIEVYLPEMQRKALSSSGLSTLLSDVVGTIQFLGTIRPDDFRVSPGVEAYPRLGDRVYAAPQDFVSSIPELMERGGPNDDAVLLEIGSVGRSAAGRVQVRPERLFGRHLAILGATGGGKSWTVATILTRSLAHKSKMVLLDATGEYRTLRLDGVAHCRLGPALASADPADECSLPATCFHESDFVALFEPSGKVQGPKLREAIRSLRIVNEDSDLADDNGNFIKVKKRQKPFLEVMRRLADNDRLEHPRTPFDVTKLPRQVLEECVWPTGGTREKPDVKFWGPYSDSDKAHCLPLVVRIQHIVQSESFAPVFRSNAPPLLDRLDHFLQTEDERLLRVSLAGISYEYRAREAMANAIGRELLARARAGDLGNAPLVVLVDEAHNFLGRTLGAQETAAKLDAFEQIAREGRKYGLNLCLATQRPRDLTEGVLSQIGTLIVHRLTNDRDRELVERACGEIDRAASAFLPNLQPGEAAIIGVDFPIPMTIQIEPPAAAPASDGPDYQAAWRA